MIKKLFITLILMLSFGTATTFAAILVNPPKSVGTYNDFGKVIRLDINPTGTNATNFEIDYAKGFNATTGFKHKVVSSATNYRTNRYQYVVRTGVAVSDYGWWTVKIYSIASDGTKSTPLTGNINVIR